MYHSEDLEIAPAHTSIVQVYMSAHVQYPFSSRLLFQYLHDYLYIYMPHVEHENNRIVYNLSLETCSSFIIYRRHCAAREGNSFTHVPEPGLFSLVKLYVR